MAMIAGALVTAGTEIILKKLISLATKHISLAWGFQAEMAKLKDTLEMIQDVLDDAEARQVRHKSVRRWLEKLKDVAHKADDVLDEIDYEILRRKVNNSMSDPIVFPHNMARKIKKINSSLTEINKTAGDFGLQKRGVEMAPPLAITLDRETDSFIFKPEVVGRDCDVLKIVEMLTSAENQEDLSVIPIVGMGGIGKTTLAKLVYNNEQVQTQFDPRVWVCVSENFDVTTLLEEILRSLTKKGCEAQSRDTILKSLSQELEGKRYLLILDDVWNDDFMKWDNFRTCLLGVNAMKGSSILVTTRSFEVASIMETRPGYCIDKLPREDCWSIFRGKAFGNGGPLMTSELEAIGKKIVDRCKGVPLAVKVAGGLMHSKKKREEWLSILNNGMWGLVEGLNGILPILKLSFDHLSSPSIKQCFGYCAIFPKDFPMEKEKLIQLWMALGYLQPNEGNNMEMEDIGNVYFENLLQNSLFECIEKDDNSDTKKYGMYDLLRDLAQFISTSECFIVDVGRSKVPRVRHLANYSRGETNHCIYMKSAKRLHTLFLRSVIRDDILVNCKCLRVLDISSAYIEELPPSVGELIHLRYLDISDNEFKNLPESIGKLYNLQTLRVQGCSYLAKLPKGVRNLINLRHLYFDGCKHDVFCPSMSGLAMPYKIGRLTSLQTLSYFRVGEEKGFRVEELGNLRNLRGKLYISDLRYVRDREEAEKADLFHKDRLDILRYEWGLRSHFDDTDTGTLEGLQPSPNLKVLEVKGFPGDNFPSWMMKMVVGSSRSFNGALFPLNNLVEILLLGCKRCEEIPMLGHLPLLQKVRIQCLRNVKIIDESFYGICNWNILGSNRNCNEVKACFPALKSFKLSDMPNLTDWKEVAQPSIVSLFPCLDLLSIDRCTQLKTAPIHLSHLNELIIENCHTLTYVFMYVRGLNTIPLRSLTISYCEKLCSISDGLLVTLPSLCKLHIEGCPNLKSIRCLQGLTSLEDLTILYCDKLTCLPSRLEYSTSLDTLIISHCPSLIFFPSVHAMSSLSRLTISSCEKLNSLPKGLHCLTRFVKLDIGPFSEELNSFPSVQFVQNSQASLRKVTLVGRPQWDSIPEHLQHLTALREITIRQFGMEALPDWFGNLVSLEYVDIYDCEKLKYLPRIEAMQRLTKLEYLGLQNCPLLEERCTEGSGPEWSKISHIELIVKRPR